MVHPARSYLICATPRTGSTLLCEALDSTQLAGHPREWLKEARLPPTSMPPALRRRAWALYMSSVIEAGTTPNSVFGVKVLWGQFKSLLDHPECAGLPLPEVVPALFPNPRYIWITRRDKVRQAISLWKASQTDQWHRYADEPAEPVREVRFDFRQIDRRARKIIVDEAAWQEYFHRCGIVPLTVVYEDLVADYEASTRQALEYLAITAPADLPFGPRQLQQQADARSDLWAQRFINQATQQSWLYRALVPGAQSLRQITGQAQARWTGWRKRD